jgi:RNA polymerase sigma-70 factor (ECF subfamily)
MTPQFELSSAHGVFATTQWSVVLAAGQTDSPNASEALVELCRTYWCPLYAYLRRRGYSEHDSQDLTQGFLAQLLERRSIETVDRQKGRFRSFLLASLKYFIADERAHACAQKRGGGREPISLDVEDAEKRYRLEPIDNRTPEKIYEHRWAITLLDQVLAKLAKEFRDAAKGELFEHLQPFLVEGSGERTYRDLAGEIGMSEEAVKKAVQRMRQRYYELFRHEIAQTVAGPDEVEEELRHLCGVLGS